MSLIKFYRNNDSYGYLSNFAPYGFALGDVFWPTVEHYFQAAKFLDQTVKLSILQTQSPMEAAKIGRDRRNKLRDDWESIKDDVMRAAVFNKFSQNKEIGQLLLATNDAHLVEHTSNDAYWADGGDGSGKNMLGLILMETRELLKIQLIK
ncbi:NADAR family protein [Hafnia alvei]|uniref:NADAR family protein n=1 Tax=Hafnia alvei TaxID=569 RepID=UPI00345DA950